MIQGLAIKLLFKTISKIVEKIDDDKMAKAHDKRLRILEKDREDVLKRLKKIEEK